MRSILVLPLLLASACNVTNDPSNDQVTVDYDEQRIRNTMDRAGEVAGEVASGVGNVATSAGRAIENEVGDVDVDVDVRRNRPEAEGNVQR